MRTAPPALPPLLRSHVQGDVLAAVYLPPSPGSARRQGSRARVLANHLRPDDTESANLERPRTRSLGHKRNLALRRYALGPEALRRTVAGEPMWRVHEAVFAILALESEPVDPCL
jgi:hypothetical protein